MWLVVTVVAVVVVVATYLTWTATRVDRLHARAAAAYSALDAQSVRRAAATADLGRPSDGDGDGVAVAQRAARLVLGAHPDDREEAENDLTRALRAVAGKAGAGSLPTIEETSRRLALARQVHSDLVRDALAVRRGPLVRLLRLARRHPLPRFFNIDDPTLEDSHDPRHR